MVSFLEEAKDRQKMRDEKEKTKMKRDFFFNIKSPLSFLVRSNQLGVHSFDAPNSRLETLNLSYLGPTKRMTMVQPKRRTRKRRNCLTNLGSI